jgi:lysyl-tRNA synthetase, class I
MFWADKVAQDIINSKEFKPYWVDDMYTPSGYAHVGSLKGPLVHDMIYRALKEAGQDVTWTYVSNDFDPIDGLPEDLMSDFKKYLGVPVRMAPSPKEGFDSFAEYFAKDFQKVLREMGVNAEFVSSWDMYHEGKFNDVIRAALDNAAKIQDIYHRVSGSKKRDAGWLPLQVICEKCGKLGTTRVHDWNGKTVEYTCEPAMVTWAQGCGHTGRISPFDGNGKLPWKVDWPAHWKVMGVTIEGAGKDHSSAGGSRDIAIEILKEVFHYPNPYNLPYEFILIGGKKMSSSKGLGLKARDMTGLLPAEIARFLFTKTDYKRAVEFDPYGTLAIPNLFDEYQKAADLYFSDSDEELARAFKYSQIGEINKPPTVRFSALAQWVQMPNMQQRIKEEGLEEWANYARVWVEKYAPESAKFLIQQQTPEIVSTLSENQKKLLERIVVEIEKDWDAEEFQTQIYEFGKEIGLNGKETFAAIYKALIGKDHGPKAAWLILSLDKAFVKKRFAESVTFDSTMTSLQGEQTITPLQKPELFSIAKDVGEKFAGLSVGTAIIRGVSIEKTNPDLEKEKEEVLSMLAGLTTEQLGQYSEIISYRKMYKAMGVDWHSRRPSPEALLRRVALSKGLYNINTCVDAYNLVVMKHRISVGAFDLDNVAFPTELRFAKENEEILLLGDSEPTKYKETELAYFDQKGGYNIDFNFRDAQRTAVQMNTKNILLNVDGVYDISPKEVEKVLKESVDIIIKYCGGTLEEFGVEIAK